MALAPRVVLVTRVSPWQAQVQQHGTDDHARFVLTSRGRDPEPLVELHRQVSAAIHTVSAAIPLAWRRARIDRAELDRFLFEPEDVIVVVGQDGLVANAAKYLDGQLVIGIDGTPGHNAGVLAPHRTEAASDLLDRAGVGRPDRVEARTLVDARLDDGRLLWGLNEVFAAHRSLQSARYELAHGSRRERQSSSGVVVATGTRPTGWASSIHRNRRCDVVLPNPTEPRRVRAGGLEVTGHRLRVHRRGPRPDGSTPDTLELTSEVERRGVGFADGIESDPLPLDRGRTVQIGASHRNLKLVLG